MEKLSFAKPPFSPRRRTPPPPPPHHHPRRPRHRQPQDHPRNPLPLLPDIIGGGRKDHPDRMLPRRHRYPPQHIIRPNDRQLFCPAGSNHRLPARSDRRIHIHIIQVSLPPPVIKDLAEHSKLRSL